MLKSLKVQAKTEATRLGLLGLNRLCFSYVLIFDLCQYREHLFLCSSVWFYFSVFISKYVHLNCYVKLTLTRNTSSMHLHSSHEMITRYMDQIKAKDSAEQKIDVPRKHVSVADVRKSLNLEKKVIINHLIN